MAKIKGQQFRELVSVKPFILRKYQRINQRRQEHLASLHLPLFNKTVLELGSGIGDHTSFFLDRGCKVVSVEPRPENVHYFKIAMDGAGYARPADLEIVEADVAALGDASHPVFSRHPVFDVVYCYGLLYHLGDPDVALALMAARCGELLLLETCVSKGDEPRMNPVDENQKSVTQSFTGKGSRPTRSWLHRELSRHFDHIYMPRTQPPHEQFPTEWSEAAEPTDRLTRAIFIASRKPLDNPYLEQQMQNVQPVAVDPVAGA